MPMPTTPPAPLGRSVARDVLHWDGVEPQEPAAARDPLGLRPEDRRALGLTAPAHTAEPAPTAPGDAHAALADLLHKGGAVGKAEKKRR